MKKHFSAIALLMASAATLNALPPLAGFNYGQATAPDGTEWENCENLSYNKEQPRAYYFSFASVDNAKKVLPEHSRYYMSLDGTWKFHWVNHPDKRPVDFFLPSFDVSGWDDIKVPGCWNVQGLGKDGSQKYGKPIYVNQPVPFMHKVAVDDWRGGVMRTPPENWTTYNDRNEVGDYRRTFQVPADWKGREIYINFDGVDSFFYLWINGKYVGFSKNSRNTASFNITDKLDPKGPNVVAVEVYRYSDGSFLESQDMFRLPGIFRSTYLTSTPQVQVSDLAVRTTIPADANPLGSVTGTVTVNAEVRNLSKKASKDMTLKYEVFPVKLYSDDTEAAAIEPVATNSFSLNAGAETGVVTEFVIPQAHLWNAETPNRYVLVASLLDKKGKAIETVSTYFGVRHVEIRDTPADKDEFGLAGRYFYVNNRPVKLKGVNRHENNLATGHTVSHEQMEREAMLMKQANINHVRNCHYNDDPYWYMVCDKYGIYLEDEANIESHEYYYGKASLSHPKEWKNAHVARNMEMVRAHVNHPSIVIWSLGNEAGPGQNFVDAYNAIKAFDTTRPVQYERNNGIVDMGSNQYPSIPWVQDAVKGKMDIKYPFHISEYAHSMGNALGNFVDYWNAMESTNFFCGGAIWDWVDQAIWNHTPDGTRYMGYGGDFGDTPNDGMFCMNGILFPDFTPKPQYAEVKKVHQNVGVKPVDMAKGRIEVFNKNYFTDLGDYDIRWSLTRNGVEVAKGNDVNRPRMAVGPRESQNWTIPYDYASLDSLGEYFVTVQFVLNNDKPWAKAGYVQMEEQLPVRSAAPAPAIAATAGSVHKPVLEKGKETDVVKGNGWEVSFDNATGTISSLSYSGKQYITPGNGPALNAYRAPVDNDVWVWQSWYANGLHNLRHKVIDRSAFTRADGAVVLQYTIESQAPCTSTISGRPRGKWTITDGRAFGPDDFKFTTNQIWTVYPDGSIELEAAINSNNPSLILPRLGYEMRLPGNLDSYTYYGRGPVNNFNDRKTAQNIGVYKSKVADQFVNFPKPQSMGNREEIRWNAVTDATGNGLLFIPTEGTMSASALPWTDMEMTMAAHPYELPKSDRTVLHLDTKVLGLGGASCGQGGPLRPDRVLGNAHTFGFIMRPVAAGDNLQKEASVSASGVRPLSLTRNRTGEVTVTSSNPDAKIMYRMVQPGKKAAKKQKAVAYTAPVNMRDGGTIEVWDAATPELTTTVEYPRIENLPVEVIFASSQEPGEEASRLVDGDPTTNWHTTYGVTVALYPHWVDFDCGEMKTIKGFTYLPRQDGDNGDIKDWKAETSIDGKNWTPADNGTFARDKKEKRVLFKTPVKARYLRFTGLSSQNGADFASGAEFSILAD